MPCVARSNSSHSLTYKSPLKDSDRMHSSSHFYEWLVSACESSKLVRDFVHSLNQQQFDSAILRTTIGCFIVSDELRCPESASDQAI